MSLISIVYLVGIADLLGMLIEKEKFSDGIIAPFNIKSADSPSEAIKTLLYLSIKFLQNR